MKQQTESRGQAFTLEGFIGSIVLLTAVVLASQAVVISPTTGGSVDRSTQAQLQQEANDALMVAENERELTWMVRYWNNSTNEFHNDTSPVNDEGAYENEQFANISSLGEVLYERFDKSGRQYNVEVVAYDDSTDEYITRKIVNNGNQGRSSVTASETITLQESQNLTAPGHRNMSLREAHDNGYPIPPADATRSDTIYNVVEVRVVLW